MNIVLFEDQLVADWHPISLMRPAYTVSCGGLTLADVARAIGPSVHGVVRAYLDDFQSEFLKPSRFDPQVETLWLNARLIPDARLIAHIREQRTDPYQLCVGGELAVALTKDAPTTLTQEVANTFLGQLDSPQIAVDFVKLGRYPHELITEHQALLASNLRYVVKDNGWQEVASNVFSKGTCLLPSLVEFDASDGPVLIDEDVELGPFTVIRGPVYLGKGVKVSPHSFIKGPTSVGHASKVGGEIGSSIIEPFSNKVHYGYLGGSYIGSWVNLGAGTTNSNLKNTYGTIRIQYGEVRVDTGQQFLGCIVGDFTKMAINTTIYTGKVVGACSNVYGAVTTNVLSFANYARSFGQITEHPVDVMKTTQKRCFARRRMEQQPRHVELLNAVYEIESAKRKLANEPLHL